MLTGSLSRNVKEHDGQVDGIGTQSTRGNVSFAFSKYHGLGNDFILIDNSHQEEPIFEPAVAKLVCERHFGVGADGVIFMLPAKSPENDARMRIFNSDGSEPEMCGNGIRCLARFMKDISKLFAEKRFLRIETLAGVMVVELVDSLIRVDMGIPILESSLIPTTLRPSDATRNVTCNVPIQVDNRTFHVTCVSMDDLELFDKELDYWGPKIESSVYFPNKTNVEFVQLVSQKEMRLLVWERGAGRTMACGTGACAAVVSAKLRDNSIGAQEVSLPGGKLYIDWDKDQHVYMTGPAEKVFDGHYAPKLVMTL
eukprot:jgi/Galph1/718/GphlegSOOS_G5580.1